MMPEHLLADIGMCILAAALLGLPAHLLRIPLLLAYLTAGVLLGPHLGFGWVASAESISTLSELGLVLLMFILGLEIDLGKLLQAGKAVLVNGVTQFLGCLSLAILFFTATGIAAKMGSYSILYLGVACSLSSTLVVVKILSDRMELDSMTSRITLGILVIQDLWAIAFLAVQPDLASLELFTLAKSFGKATALVAVAWLLARYVLPTLFARTARHPELLLISAMAWCFAMCGLAHELSLSVEMGALIAGVSIAAFPYHFDVATKVSSLRDFFITLFFVALGLQIPMPTQEIFLLSMTIVGFAIASRLLTITPVLQMMKYGHRASLLPALNLGQVSEFALVLGALGVGYGHISKDLLSAFVLAMVFSALISSLVIPRAHEIYQHLSKVLVKMGLDDRITDAENDETLDQRPQVVLLGFHRSASSLLHALLVRHSEGIRKRLFVVDFNPEAHQKLKELEIPCKYGDISQLDLLRQLNIADAKLLICTIPDSLLKGITNLQLLRNLKAIAPQSNVIVSADTIESAIELYAEGANYVFIPRIVGAEFLADAIENIQTLGSNSARAKSIANLRARTEVLK